MFYPDKCIGCGVCVDACPNGCIGVNDKKEMFFDREKCTECCACTKECYAGARRVSGDDMSLDEIKKEVDKDMVFLQYIGRRDNLFRRRGHVLSRYGKGAAEYYKSQGVTTALETCGYVPWENYER